jgi:hypothetical protein
MSYEAGGQPGDILPAPKDLNLRGLQLHQARSAAARDLNPPVSRDFASEHGACAVGELPQHDSFAAGGGRRLVLLPGQRGCQRQDGKAKLSFHNFSYAAYLT